MRIRALLAGLGACALLAACGGSGEPARTGGERPSASGREGPLTRPEDIDRLSRGQIESFAEVELPASASGLRSAVIDGFMDDAIEVSFTLPADELDPFVRASGFEPPLEDGFNPLGPLAGRALGWKLPADAQVRGLEEVTSADFGRSLAVTDAGEGRVTVYLTASQL